MIRSIWNVHNPARKISLQASLNVDFYDPKPEISAKNQAETWEKLIELGVISAVDVAMERNQEFQSRDDAKAYLEKIKEENDLFRGNNNANVSQ
jgi:hypothetical protein